MGYVIAGVFTVIVVTCVVEMVVPIVLSYAAQKEDSWRDEA